MGHFSIIYPLSATWAVQSNNLIANILTSLEYLQDSSIGINVQHCREKFKKIKMSASTSDQIATDIDEECEEYEISNDNLFEKVSMSTQTANNISTVATQTPWIVYIQKEPNSSYVAVDADGANLSEAKNSFILNQNNYLDKFNLESDPAYVCDEELYDFLNKIKG
ncbi:unnamed protein product [Rotaria socialis]|uniref:Uncharacterized protein n=1 Tax=Rotaria socialis TaxID=392032 RepID=A0A818DQ43_9BILA|nr:unnamed protein product [Rotaria socialis]CAF4567444.1 unnamed protein product [Rotaria socialis]